MKSINKLKKNHEFQSIIGKKKQIVTGSLVLYFVPNNMYLRVGISVSKKFANAVQRNNIRRKVRHALDEINLWNLKFNIVLIVRKKFIELNFEEQKKKINKILERL